MNPLDIKVNYQGKVFIGRGFIGNSWHHEGNAIVLVLPDVMGCKILDVYRCHTITKLLGCSTVAVDLYGDLLSREERESPEALMKAFDLMNNLLVDPIYLRGLLVAFLEQSSKQLNARKENSGVIGFCFGGACAMELYRTGTPIKAIISMHGTLHAQPLPTLDGKPAPPVKTHPPKAKYHQDTTILICNGRDDPLCPLSVIEDFEKEMKIAQPKSWSVSQYSNARHAFSTPGRISNDIIKFDMNAARRAWISSIDVLSHTFECECLYPVPSHLWLDKPIISHL